MNWKKIFMSLIGIVAVVAIGVFLLNIVMPNAITQVCSAAEGALYNATKISIDINGDGHGGKDNASGTYTAGESNSSDKASNGVGVQGFN